MNLDTSLQELLREVGTFIKTEFERFDYDSVQYKSENDPFTFVDVEAERRLRAGCEKLIPECGFITEELENSHTDREYVWIIDPIDGTSNFTHGMPHFCIALALQQHGETIMGYVYQPITEEMFHAEKGKGAFLNGTPIKRSERKEMKLGLATTGFPYAIEGWVRDYLDMVFEVMEATHGVRRFGSAALDLAAVASGRIDIYFETELKPWDAAAGALLVQEAGGKVTDLNGGDNYLYGRQLLATNGYLHDEMLEITTKSKVMDYINR